MDDLLKNAIADAKAVRETALVNAKLALEEAFTPKIQSMLSKKIQSETEGEAEEGEEIPAEEEEEEFEEEGEEEVPADEEGEEVPAEEEEEAEEGEYEEDLDLEAIIRELEGEEAEEGDDEEVAESEEAEEDEEAVEEQSDSSKIGSGDNKVDSADASDEEDPGNSTDVEKLGEQLKEYKEAVVFLKDKLHEVNILNAKLLFTNKLFKSYNLNNNQKLKVVETFDRAQSTREIKLVYTTLAEQFNGNTNIHSKKSIKESASSAIGSTKPSKESTKVISEENDVANRFRKLAGILKG